MSVNPDIAEDREATKILGGHLKRIPVTAELRFIERGVPTENPAVMKLGRILQQYQWSRVDMKHDWYDVPMEVEDE